MQILDDILKEGSVNFEKFKTTRLNGLNGQTFLDHIVNTVRSFYELDDARYVLAKDELHTAAQIISKHFYSFANQMTSSQIAALLYLTVAELPYLTEFVTQKCYDDLREISYPMEQKDQSSHRTSSKDYFVFFMTLCKFLNISNFELIRSETLLLVHNICENESVIYGLSREIDALSTKSTINVLQKKITTRSQLE